ncbi:MAG: hypothetical protein JNK72_24505 [Myxococcales bacterium]|nr:hypothetical protein [Myxococcales bacterium]
MPQTPVSLSALSQSLASLGYTVDRCDEQPRRLDVLAHRGRRWLSMTVTRGLFSTQVTVALEGDPSVVELTVRPELVGESLDKLFGVTVDTNVGDVDFDGRFVVASAPADAATKLLPARVRAALRALPAGDGGPVLRVADSVVSLRYEGPADVGTLLGVLGAVEATADAADALYEGTREAVDHGAFRSTAALDRAVDPRAREADRRALRRTRLKFASLVGGTLGVAGLVLEVLSGVLRVG